MRNLVIRGNYALRMGGGLTKNVSRRARRNLKRGCVTAARSRHAVILNAHMTSKGKRDILRDARRAWIAGLDCVNADASRVLDSSFLESSFAIGTG
jgi:hypothetical protein